LYEPSEGKILFDGQDVTHIHGRELRELRADMQIVFQDPYSSLNPRMTIKSIVEEGLVVHRMGTKAERLEKVKDTLRKVGLDPSYINRYPHEFSGGQRQRISVARALALNPRFMVLDEPISALDVSIQSQILNIFEDLQAELGLTYLFIAHDLAVVKHISNRIGVMYLGRLMEVADKHALYAQPLHPYTQALLTAVPRSHPARERQTRTLLKGEPPSPADPPSGCVFRTRCPHAMERCAVEVPPLRETQPGQAVACHLYD
jgi:peptide/nickel transport system ATP-binding protein/oligopeptide transport system ATP-binding protein